MKTEDMVEVAAKLICSMGLGQESCPSCEGAEDCGDHWKHFVGEGEAIIAAVLPDIERTAIERLAVITENAARIEPRYTFADLARLFRDLPASPAVKKGQS